MADSLDAIDSTKKTVTILQVHEVGEETKRIFTGEVKAKQQATLSFEIGGKLVSLQVEEGDFVAANQSIASLDTTDYVLQLQNAHLQHQLAETKYQKLLRGVRAEEIEQAEKEIEILKARLSQAQNNHARTKRLVEEGALPEIELEASETTLLILGQQLEKAELVLALQLDGAREEDLELQKLEIELMDNGIAQAKERIKKAEIRAPFTGLISNKFTEVGESISPGKPIVEITQISPVYVQVEVPAGILSQLELSQAVTVYLPEIKQRLEGKMTSKYLLANPQTKNYTVEIEIENPDLEIFPGLLAEVELLNAIETGVWVPLQAVVNRGEDDPFVFVYDETSEQVSQRKVRMGQIKGDLLLIEEGLSSGEKIVVQGAAFVADGDVVHVHRVSARPVGETHLEHQGVTQVEVQDEQLTESQDAQQTEDQGMRHAEDEQGVGGR